MPIDPYAAPVSVAATPELTGGRSIAVLLSHGFTGSTASIRPWAEHLGTLGYAVEVPRLPGHGTSWQELDRTTWQDWYDELARAFERLAGQHEAVVVGGLSMGGGLALRLAADRPDRVAGVVVVNPVVATLRLDRFLLPLVRRVRRAYPGVVNDIKKPGMDEHGYHRMPLRATASMMAGWKALRADLGSVTAPLLVFKSVEDHVVDQASLDVLVATVSSSDLTVRRLADSYHVATLDNDAPTIFAESAAFVRRVTGH